MHKNEPGEILEPHESNTPNRTPQPFETELSLRKKPKILVVGIEQGMRELVANTFQERYEVAIVVKEVEALRYLLKYPVNLIVSNALMPEIDGCTLIETLRESKDYHSIPIILLTASKDQVKRLKFINIGLDDYLIKPFSAKELLTRTQVMLERAESRKSPLLEP